MFLIHVIFILKEYYLSINYITEIFYQRFKRIIIEDKEEDDEEED